LLHVAQRKRRSTVPKRKSLTPPGRGTPFSYKQGVLISHTAMSRMTLVDMSDMLNPLILYCFVASFHDIFLGFRFEKFADANTFF
jgi:hypothetical protein